MISLETTITFRKSKSDAPKSNRDNKKIPANRDLKRLNTLWFDFDKRKFRSDVLNEFKSQPETKPVRHVQGINCERENYFLDYLEIRTDTSAQSVELKPMTEARKKRSTEVFDPRLLGLVPSMSVMLHHRQLESYLERPDRKNTKVRKDIWQGLDCFVLTIDNERGNHYEYWIIPSRSFGTVRSQVESDFKGTALKSSVTTELQQVGKLGIWFPLECVYEDSLGTKEVLRVKQISLNEPIADDVFSLAGMSITPGTVIDGETPNGKQELMTWTGKELIKYVQPKSEPSEIFEFAQPASLNRSFWLVVAAVACCVAAAIALGIFWRRGRTNARASSDPTGGNTAPPS